MVISRKCSAIMPTAALCASAEAQIRSQMLKANSSSGGVVSAGQQSTAGADTTALLSDRLHTDTGMAGGVTVVEKPLGAAKATADKAATAAAAAVDAVGTAAVDVAKAAGGIVAGGVAAAAAEQLGVKDACLPTKWTGNAADYKLTKCAELCFLRICYILASVLHGSHVGCRATRARCASAHH